MLLVSSATMMPTTMYPEGQYQCLRNHIRSSAFRTRTRDGRINSGLRDRSVCVLLKVLAVWIWVVATEVMLLVVSVLLLKLVVDRWGPGRLRGMAIHRAASRLIRRESSGSVDRVPGPWGTCGRVDAATPRLPSRTSMASRCRRWAWLDVAVMALRSRSRCSEPDPSGDADVRSEDRSRPASLVAPSSTHRRANAACAGSVQLS